MRRRTCDRIPTARCIFFVKSHLRYAIGWVAGMRVAFGRFGLQAKGLNLNNPDDRCVNELDCAA